MNFTTTISAEVDGYVALCAELDIASQGDSVEQASANLREAVRNKPWRRSVPRGPQGEGSTS